jgi:protein SCO1
MPMPVPSPSRRRFCARGGSLAAGALAAWPLRAMAQATPRASSGGAGASTTPGPAPSAVPHGNMGPVLPPREAPSLLLTLHDGRKAALRELLEGRITAVQLMFTTCSATCPIQGATFAALQEVVLPRLPNAQLLSISIDPLGDDAKALAAWRAKFGAGPAWLAGVPAPAQAEVMLDFTGGRARGSDRHTAQIHLFNAKGQLHFRMAEFASARATADAMAEVARRS